jgi:uncharacterized protein
MMSSQQKVNVVKEAYEAFGRGDIGGLLNKLTTDVDWWTPGEPETMSHTGTHRGHEGVKQFFKELDRNEQVIEFVPREFIAGSDHVAVLGHYRAKVKSTGRELEYDWAHVFAFRGDKIASFREYCDTAAAALAYTHHVA